MGAQQLITQRDHNKHVQSVDEGITAATYAVTPTNPAFACHGQDAVLIKAPNPVVAEKRLVGNVARQEVTKTRESNKVTYRAKLMTADEDLLDWCANAANGDGTCDDSRTFYWSYDDDGGTEVFEQFLGCKPESWNLSVDNSGYIILEIQMDCKTITIDGSGPTIGSGSAGTALTGTPLTHADAAAAPFTYNSGTLELRNFTLSGSNVLAAQDSLGSTNDLYKAVTQQSYNGSCSIFKSDDTEDTDARARTPRTATFIVDSGQITITMTRFSFLPSGEEMAGDTADATMENKNFECDVVAVA